MLTFGPVAEAAHGGHSNPAFDLLIGLSVLALTWVGYGKGKSSGRVTIWAALGVSALCGVFIVSGVVELFR